MVTNDRAAIASLFELSDEETEFINEFLRMYHMITRKLDEARGKVCDGEIKIPQIEYDLLRGAVKALCLFWLDYQRYQTCKDDAELTAKRAEITEAMREYCKKHPKNARGMGMMTLLQAEIARYYLENSKKGMDLDDSADLESCAFFLALAKKGLFLREQYAEVQKLSRKFILRRRKEMFSSAEGRP
jgi:hypothetical protein